MAQKTDGVGEPLMQRDTAIILVGIGLVLILLLLGVALHISAPPSHQPVSQPEPTPTVTPSVPLSFQPPQTVSPISPPAIISPSLPPAPIETPSTPTFGGVQQKGVFVPTNPAPLPPTPSPLSPSLSHFPTPKPSAILEPETEALLWAKSLVLSHRPHWQLKLAKGVDMTMKDESYAVSIDPNNQVTIEAKKQAGWLYGLLDLVEKLQWRDSLPANWRWSPLFSERGLVVENPDWLVKPPRSSQALQNLLREQLKELSWWRFNTLVLKCDGREHALDIVLGTFNRLAPDFNVKVVVWSSVPSPAVQKWFKQGGQVIANGYPMSANALTIIDKPEEVAQFVDYGKTVVLATKLVAPNVPPPVLQFKRNRDKLVLMVKLDEGYRDAFWFDPTWAHQLVWSVKNSGLKGLWIHVRSMPSTWAKAAFALAFKNPETEGEAFWHKRWSNQIRQADKWLYVFREASRILPELLWLGVADEPQYGASLKSFFVARPIDISWGFTVLSVPETLSLSRKPENQTTLTADEIANRLEQRAKRIWDLISQLPEPASYDWKVAKSLSLLNSWIAQFYSSKIQAAISWGRFEEGDKASGQNCLFHLVKSVKAWEQAVAIANSVYSPNNRWSLRLPEWKRELQEYQSIVTGSLP
ncbi:MAG: hypothetical protein NZ805_03900 [Armatimonadetes bacterium]|nr:hypothetical protein [Armatimonadota bacterium]MDW8028839.1 hypothetical protein [Armatimonadota bacterium]